MDTAKQRDIHEAAQALASNLVEDFSEKDDTKEEMPKVLQIAVVTAAIERLILKFA